MYSVSSWHVILFYHYILHIIYLLTADLVIMWPTIYTRYLWTLVLNNGLTQWRRVWIFRAYEGVFFIGCYESGLVQSMSGRPLKACGWAVFTEGCGNPCSQTIRSSQRLLEYPRGYPISHDASSSKENYLWSSRNCSWCSNNLLAKLKDPVVRLTKIMHDQRGAKLLIQC